MNFEPDLALLARADSSPDASPRDELTTAAELGTYIEAMLTQRRYRYAQKVMRFCMDNWKCPSPIVLRFVLSKLKPYEFLVGYKEFYDFCTAVQPQFLAKHARLASLLKPEKKT
jgi:hypothetical protein